MNKLCLLFLLVAGCVAPPPENWQPSPLDHAVTSSLVAKYNTLDSGKNVPSGPVRPQVGDKCDNCSGTGVLGDGVVKSRCPQCGGDGKIDEKDLLPTGDVQSEVVAEPKKEVINNVAKRNEIIMYTGPRCIWCLKWQKEVKGKLEKAGWKITEVQETRSVGIPHFEMYINGVRKTHQGYMSVEQFTKYFEEVNGVSLKKR